MRLELHARREALEPARQALLDFLAPHGVAGRLTYQAELVLEEVLMNLAWHAYGDEAHRPVWIEARLSEEELVLRFEDEGVPFDPTGAEPPPTPKGLEDARVGGLGLALVRKSARAMRYRRDGNRNVLEVTLAR